MKFFKILSLTLMLLTAVSCGTPKEITYFQDLKPGQTQLAITDPVEIRVRPKDKLSILVNAPDPKLSNMFNLPIISQTRVGYNFGTQINANITKSISLFIQPRFSYLPNDKIHAPTSHDKLQYFTLFGIRYSHNRFKSMKQ